MMSTIFAICAVVSTIVAAAGVPVAIFIFRRQVLIQVFLAFTKRYEDILGSLPESAQSVRFDLEGPLPEESKELNVVLLRYLNLSCDEYCLFKEHILFGTVWHMWEKEMKRTLASALIQRAWRTLKCEFRRYPDFVEFVQLAREDSMATLARWSTMEALTANVASAPAAEPRGTTAGDRGRPPRRRAHLAGRRLLPRLRAPVCRGARPHGRAL